MKIVMDEYINACNNDGSQQLSQEPPEEPDLSLGTSDLWYFIIAYNSEEKSCKSRQQ